ncbi:PRC-barrel domain-containing protein [Alkalihalobacillus deserti]|uniref:PRC-barrel domain-containing protein n=1 Tax=Alkalihalobacillus deserti TaxID=2879466 RepID=UPI001D15402E|nr:PRC-barrel domain-containing protein [Alkalihalobacillus deserti]
MLMKDGELGSIDNLYFDPVSLNIRYIVGDTKTWFFGGKVLLSLEGCTAINIENQTISINATKEQVKNSPKLGEHSPIVRSFEERLSDYYGWRDTISPSVSGVDLSGNPFVAVINSAIMTDDPDESEINPDYLLLSVNELRRFKISQIGKVSDVLINHNTWKIELLELEITGFLSKQYVPISTKSITNINWSEQTITLNNDHYNSAENDLRAHVHAGQPFSK